MSGKQQAGGGAAPEHTPLKLRAHDAEDLGALAACLQDALVPLADVVYLKAEKRFVMVANRFMWERGAQKAPAPMAEPGPGAGPESATPVSRKPRPGRCITGSTARSTSIGSAMSASAAWTRARRTRSSTC